MILVKQRAEVTISLYVIICNGGYDLLLLP